MKEIKALVSFAGITSMVKNEVKKVDDNTAADLIQAKFAVEVKKPATTKKKGDA